MAVSEPRWKYGLAIKRLTLSVSCDRINTPIKLKGLI